MKNGSRPTLTDVARRAGVSRSTASRALGEYGYSSPEVRAKVQQAAEQLGYQPDRAASSMRSGRSGLVAFLSADISDAFFSTAMRGICDVAEHAGYQVVVLNSSDDTSQEAAALRVLESHRVDGLIVCPTSVDDSDHLAAVVRSGVPVVSLDRQLHHDHVDSVVTDNRPAAQQCVRTLIDAGHRRVGLVASAQPRESPVLDGRGRSLVITGPARPSVERTQGYVDALREAGIVPARSLMRFARQDRPEQRAEAVAAVLRARPTALFTADSYATKAAFTEISRQGLRIPDDISLIGFDELDWTTLVTPQVSVVTQPAYDMGALAARRLLERLQHDVPEPGQVWRVPSRFVPRHSVGSPHESSDES